MPITRVFQSPHLLRQIVAYQHGLDATTHYEVVSWSCFPHETQCQCLLFHLQTHDEWVLHALYGFRPRLFTETLVALAIEAGDLRTIRYLSEQPTSRLFTPETMDTAARFGRLHIVQYLHTHRQEGCTYRAMDLAAAGGHLEVVMFLHANRKEGCSTDAIDGAAANGHFEVVQFLHNYRQEGCTHQAVRLAIHHGHTAIVKFLFERYGGNELVVLCAAASRGNLDLVHYFCDKYPQRKRFLLDVVGCAVERPFPALFAYLRTV